MTAVGDKGLDFASMPVAGGYPQMARDGAKFVSRYSDGGAGSSKCTKDGEIAQAVAAGMDFWANFEAAENTPTLGAAEGAKRGAADHDFWNERGYAPGAGIAVSWEPGTDTSQWNNVAAFLENYQAKTGRPQGMYSSLPTLIEMRRRGLVQMTWLSMSAAASGHPEWGSLPQAQYAVNMQELAADNGINLCQNRNRWYGTGADEDVVTTLPTQPWSHLQALGAHMQLDDTPANYAVIQKAFASMLAGTGQPVNPMQGAPNPVGYAQWLGDLRGLITQQLADDKAEILDAIAAISTGGGSGGGLTAAQVSALVDAQLTGRPVDVITSANLGQLPAPAPEATS